VTGQLDGRVALVTGASSGIGEATAADLVEQGARVTLAARRTDRLEALATRLGQGTALVRQTDVSDEAAVRAAVDATVEHFGGLDILVNNAGVMLLGPIAQADTSDWRRMVETNVMGLMYATHAVLPLMKAQGGGHIVNVSSVAGRTVSKGSGVYNVTKWGVGAFSESLRKEVSPDKIRVTIIEPGAVKTELTEHITHKETKQQVQGWIGSMTPLESEDIANAIVYAVTQPPRVNVNEILIRPTEQDS